MLIPLDFSTAQEYDLNTYSYASASDYSTCELKAQSQTGQTSGDAYNKALAKCKAEEKEAGTGTGWTLFYSKCKLEAIQKTGQQSGEAYNKAFADCKLQQKESGGVFGGAGCDSACKKAGVKPEDMLKCVADCKLKRRAGAGEYFSQIDFGNIFGGLFGKKPDTTTYDPSTGTYGSEQKGIGILPIIIGIVVLIVFIVIIMQVMKKRGKTATA